MFLDGDARQFRDGHRDRMLAARQIIGLSLHQLLVSVDLEPDVGLVEGSADLLSIEVLRELSRLRVEKGRYLILARRFDPAGKRAGRLDGVQNVGERLLLADLELHELLHVVIVALLRGDTGRCQREGAEGSRAQQKAPLGFPERRFARFVGLHGGRMDGRAAERRRKTRNHQTAFHVDLPLSNATTARVGAPTVGSGMIQTPDRRIAYISAATILIMSCVLVVVGFAVESTATLPFDRAVLLGLRDPGDLAVPIGPRWLLDVTRDLTSLGSTTVTLLIMIVVAAGAGLRRRWREPVFVLAAVGAGSALVNLVKLALRRVRPDVVPHLTSEVTFSFPSSHAAVSIMTYGALAILIVRGMPQLRCVAAAVTGLLVLAIGATRLYLGVHYPTDVFAGWVFGATWLLVCWRIFRVLDVPH